MRLLDMACDHARAAPEHRRGDHEGNGEAAADRLQGPRIVARLDCERRRAKVSFTELQAPGQVVCGGMSYKEHNEELSDVIRIPEEIKGLPFFFIKAQRALSRDGAPIVLPDIRRLIRRRLETPYGQVTGEVELGIVLKERTWRIEPEAARRHILGY